MPEIVHGKYRNFTMDEIIEYGEMPKEYRDLLQRVYGANHEEVPLDILAHLLEMVSYTKLISNYVDNNKNSRNLVVEDMTKVMSVEIQDFQFNSNIINQFKVYNMFPLQITDDFIIYAVPEHIEVPIDDQKFILARRTISELLGAIKKQEKFVGVSNLRFMQGLRMVCKDRPFTEKNLIFLPEQRVTKLAIDAILRNASDVYFDPKPYGYMLSLGIFNDQIPYKKIQMTATEKELFMSGMFALMQKVLSKLEWVNDPSKDFKIPNLGELESRYEGRVNVLKSNRGYAPVIRIQDRERSSKPLEDLKLNPKVYHKLKDLASNPSGIVAVAGGTGQGKTTTITSLIDSLQKKRPGDRIEEISQPVEIEMEDISQISLDSTMSLDFKVMEDAQTRRNAKIIYLGEINTAPSAKFATNMALQDKYILTSIHTQGVSTIPSRVRGMTFDEPGLYPLFLEVISGMVHQNMLKEVCTHCGEEIDIDSVEPMKRKVLEGLGFSGTSLIRETYDESCPICNGMGRLVDKPVVCYEVLEVNDLLRDEIKNHSDNPRSVIDKELRRQGTMGVQDAIIHLQEKRVGLEQVWYRYSLRNIDMSLVYEGGE